MHVIIMGCGRVGAQLAARLGESDHQIYVIDRDRASFARLPRGAVELGTITFIESDGASPEALEAADIEEADVFIAVTGEDAVNGMAAQKVRALHRVKRVLCAVKDEDLRQMYESLGVDTVNPTRLVTDALASALPENPA